MTDLEQHFADAFDAAYNLAAPHIMGGIDDPDFDLDIKNTTPRQRFDTVVKARLAEDAAPDAFEEAIVAATEGIDGMYSPDAVVAAGVELRVAVVKAKKELAS